ncbi:hypothetical protein GQ600_17753 [Phytophthora cactorum]|nr:hypothetical protein GQ600_17753 [Phytophthora cactorum]
MQEPWHVYFHIRNAVYSRLGFRQKQLFRLLDARFNLDVYKQRYASKKRMCITPSMAVGRAGSGVVGGEVLFKNFCKSRTYFHGHGVNEQLAAPAGINRFVFSQKESLGIVCYFPNLETLEETKVKEFSWTAQLKHHMLNKMREVGIDLENIVYFRGEMHYLVMTPKRNNLLVRGVVKQNHPNSKDLVRDDNINQSVLHAFVKRIIDFAGIPRRTDFTRVSLSTSRHLRELRRPQASSLHTARNFTSDWWETHS